ncbi:hypothetical protein ABVT39_025972 [Epinephelus coioides]
MKEIEGLKTIQALAQCHAEILRTKLHKVCLVLIEQVKNLGSAAACSAMNTVAELYGHLQRAMDLEVEGTGQALLLKLASNNFIQQQANLALDAIVANCSHGHILSALFNTRLSHRCAAVEPAWHNTYISWLTPLEQHMSSQQEGRSPNVSFLLSRRCV